MDPRIAETADRLRDEHTAVEVDDRTIRVVNPVKGDPGLSVLRVLGMGQAASPVGGAAHGPSGVAVGVWRSPELYVARWIKGRRWVVGYRLTGESRLNDYVRTEGRVPTRLEIGNWYGAVPDAVNEAFMEAGLLLDEPPFPVPAAPPPSPVNTTARAAAPSKPRPAAPKRPAARRLAAQTTRLCPSCRMYKAHGQFVAGSDSCVDCR